MVIKEIRDEDFANYKKPSMFIGFPTCSWKCERECGMRVCQNSALATAPSIEISVNALVDRYMNNPITHAVVCGGLEPMDSFEDLWRFILHLRVKGCDDDIIIYSGYYKHEIPMEYLQRLQIIPNIIVKFGRFVPNQQPHYDDVLGVKLASSNQYAEVIS